MKIKKIIVLIIIPVLFISVNNYAQRKNGMGNEKHRMFMMQKLNLTEQQQKKIDDLNYDHQKVMIKLRSDLQMKKLELRKAYSSDKISRNDIIKLTKDINTVKNDISLEKVNHQMNVYEVLDDTQKKLWKEQKENFGRNKNRMKESCISRKH